MKDLTHLEVDDFPRIVWKRRWYFLIAFILVAAGASSYAYWVPDVFKSETRIMVEEPMVSEDYVRPTVRSTPEDRINSIRQQLASRTFLQRMIEQFQMYGYGRSGFDMEAAVKAAEKQIGIEKTSNNTFTISFVATVPEFAQKFTRQLALELIRISTSSNKNKVIATDQFIDEQLRQTTEALASQEEKITKFKILHLGELPSQSEANVTALNGLHSQLAATETAIQQAQERQKLLDFKQEERQRLNLLSSSLAATENATKASENTNNAPSAAEVELASKKALLAQYLAKYTPDHPDVITLQRDIARLEQGIRDGKSSGSTEPKALGEAAAAAVQDNKPAAEGDPMEASFQFEANSIKAEIARREKEKQEILEQIKTYQRRLNLAPALEQELAALIREEEVLKSQYANLQKQKFSTQMATTVETDNKNETYRIIDEANMPGRAEYPNRLQIVLLGIGGGLIVGLVAAFGRELLDNTTGSEEEAKTLLKLPVLVTIPTVTKEKKRRKTA
jgi:polysaccharide chain length determinant protein (PEP-CTERM system associated)